MTKYYQYTAIVKIDSTDLTVESQTEIMNSIGLTFIKPVHIDAEFDVCSDAWEPTSVRD